MTAAAIASQLCEFVAAQPGRVQCKHCARTLETDSQPASIRMACKKRRALAQQRADGNVAEITEQFFTLIPASEMPCAHRGEITRQERCRLVSCRGGVLFDVYRCNHFGDECSIQNRAVKGLRVCKKCPARKSGDLVQLSALSRPEATTSRVGSVVGGVQKATVPIAVVIPCHNYGRFLEEAIESVRAQTVQPAELIVVDDASTDDTAEVCERLGVTRIAVDYRNPHQTRGAGFAATTAEWVCFLDADDTIEPAYLAQAAERFSKGVGLVFSDVDQFGAANGRIVYEAGDISTRNFAHAGSVARRIALASAQVFDQTLPGEVLEDWWMWRRVLEAGWQAVKSPAIYRYRRHEGSRSKDLSTRDPVAGAGLALEDITIAIPLAGRAKWWPRMRGWLEQQTWPRQQTRLLIVDTSDDETFSAEVRSWLATCWYPSTQYVAMRPAGPGIADADRHQHAVYRGVQAAMPRIYNRVRQEVTTPYVLIVEDDILPPVDAAERLLQSFDQDTVSVSGAYRSRYQPENYIAWDRGSNPLQTAGDGVQVVGGNGFGCVMLRSSVLKQTVLHHGGRAGDFDPNFYADIDPRWVAKLDWSIRCDHAGLAA